MGIIGQDIDIRIYFTENAPKTFAEPHVKKVARQMRRAGAETMTILCGMTDKEIIKTRNVGEKGQEIVFLMREKYAAENHISLFREGMSNV